MPKASMSIKIISWIITFAGILQVVGAFSLLSAGNGFSVKSDLVFILHVQGWFELVAGLARIVISFMIRDMRKWGLYGFSLITLISLLSFIFLIPAEKELNDWIPYLAWILLLIYLWIEYEKHDLTVREESVE